MATQPTSMNIIKQVLIRLSQKESIRSIASTLHISKNTVSRYKAISEADPMSVRELIAIRFPKFVHIHKSLHTFIILSHIKAIIPIITRVNHPIMPSHKFLFKRSSAMNMNDAFFGLSIDPPNSSSVRH